MSLPKTLDGSSTLALSASLPVINGRDDQFVGETVAQIPPEPIVASLHDADLLGEGGFTVMISTERDRFGHDTFSAPGFVLGQSTGAAIEDVLLPHDRCVDVFQFGPECQRNQAFFSIVTAMQRGSQGSLPLSRLNEDKEVEEILFNFAPVLVPVLTPLNSSDFSRGVNKRWVAVYSIALCEFESEIAKTFTSLEGVLGKLALQARGILGGIIVLSFLFVLWISGRMAMSITIPVAQLLSLVSCINT